MIKYNCKFYPRKRSKAGEDPEKSLQMVVSITWQSKRLLIYTNARIKPDEWQLQKINKEALEIVEKTKSDLGLALRQLISAKEIGLLEGEITEALLKSQYDRIQGTEGKKKVDVHKQTILDDLQQHLEEGTQRENTKKQIRTIKAHLQNFKPNTRLADVDSDWLTGFKNYLLDQQLQNITIKKHLKVMRQLMNWAAMKGVPIKPTALIFKPNLKVKDKVVVTLTWDELDQLYNWVPPAGRVGRGMAYVRDLFVFSAIAGGMRPGDLMALSHENIVDGFIQFTTSKTGYSARIPVNETLRSILDKYRNTYSPLPKYTAQAANRKLKEICKELGFNEVVPVVQEIGSKNTTVLKKKYEIISLKHARKTFNTIGLERGIPEFIINDLITHSMGQVKRSYVKITDAARIEAMQKMELPITKTKPGQI